VHLISQSLWSYGPKKSFSYCHSFSLLFLSAETYCFKLFVYDDDSKFWKFQCKILLQRNVVVKDIYSSQKFSPVAMQIFCTTPLSVPVQVKTCMQNDLVCQVPDAKLHSLRCTSPVIKTHTQQQAVLPP